MGRYRRTSVSVEVDVDLDDVLADVPTDTLVELLARRGVDTARDIVRTAIAQIRRGDLADAITTLEREFFPKWASVEQSTRAYEVAAQAGGRS